MSNFLVVLTTLFCFGLIHGDDVVNQGASTSTQQELPRCAQCELRKYASRLVHLMTSEDIRGGDPIQLIANVPNEVEAFYNQIVYYTSMAEYGSPEPSDLPEAMRNRRLGYFFAQLDEILLLLLEKSSAEHYEYRFFYEYSHLDQSIHINEVISCNENDNCLCNAHSERSTLTIPLRLPIPKKLEKRYSIFWNKNKPTIREEQSETNNVLDETRGELTFEETTAYHIIPLPLITRFFYVWLADQTLPDAPHDGFLNGCLHTLFGRLRRSMQKILLVSMKKSRVYDIDQPQPTNYDDISFSNETVLIESLENSISWLSGNIFIAPTKRGPFDPTFQKTGDELLYAFEYDADELVERDHYYDLLTLFNRLLDFITQAPNFDPFERLIHGFRLFILMALKLKNKKISYLKTEKWVKEHPDWDDLASVLSDETKMQMMMTKYWKFKKHQRRKRFDDYDRYDLFEESLNIDLNNNNSLNNVVKHQWKDFVLSLIRALIDSRSRGETLNWSCNFTRLYQGYLYRSINHDSSENCDTCLSFDEYLYSKISDLNNWNICNSKKELSSTNRWCAAWKRIKNVLYTYDHHFKFFKPIIYNRTLLNNKTFSQDCRILVHWLLAPNEMNEVEHLNLFNETIQSMPENIINSHVKSSSVDIGWCLVATLIPTIVTNSNECYKTMG